MGLMTSRSVLSLDPGKTTGWALFVGGRLASYGETDCWGEIERLISRLPPGESTVVYENIFVSSPHLDLSGVYTIGVIEYLCRGKEIEIVRRPPSMMRAVRKWGVPVDSVGSSHISDAIAHGISYLGIDKVDYSILERSAKIDLSHSS